MAAGDIHGSEVIAENLAKKAEKYKVDFVILTGDIFNPLKKERVISPFKKRNLEVLFIPGNWDTDLDVKFLKEQYKLKSLDGYYFRKDNVDFIGIGSSNFKMDHTEKDFKKIKNLFEVIKSHDNKRVLVSHLHPMGSVAEFSGIRGSYFLRKLIDEIKPDIAISSHIHEAEGLEQKMGKTKFFVVGKKGKIIDIE